MSDTKFVYPLPRYSCSTFNTVSSRPGVMSPIENFCYPLREEFDESIADPTYFQPTSEAVRSIASSMSKISTQYSDFPDGRDTGIDLPVSRKKGVDIAEVSQSVQRQKKTLQKEIADAKADAEFNQVIADLKQSRNDVTSVKNSVSN